MLYFVVFCSGVVNELAQERLARESAAISGEQLPVEELAEITKQIIESRDIKAIIESATKEEAAYTGKSY